MPDGSRKWKKRVLTAVPREAEGTKAAFVTATVEGAAIRATSSRRGVNPERPSCYNDRGVRVVEHFWTGWMSVFPGHKNKLLFRVRLHYENKFVVGGVVVICSGFSPLHLFQIKLSLPQFIYSTITRPGELYAVFLYGSTVQFFVIVNVFNR